MNTERGPTGVLFRHNQPNLPPPRSFWLPSTNALYLHAVIRNSEKTRLLASSTQTNARHQREPGVPHNKIIYKYASERTISQEFSKGRPPPMESLSFLPPLSSFPHRFPTHNKPKVISSPNKARQVAFVHNRGRYGDSQESGSRWSVDESMIVLRRRIHEMRVAESGHEPPAHWMEWERQGYASYAEHVCDLVGLLQTVLLSTRPMGAMAVASALLLGVPTSLLMAVLWVLKIC